MERRFLMERSGGTMLPVKSMLFDKDAGMLFDGMFFDGIRWDNFSEITVLAIETATTLFVDT